ncbi:hypothetical protein KAZ01_00695, partial [Candidatus Gracilibacteria bacterium]|nr:hypothetical protein [Candidatus Gracilibacteria bacterium]
PFSNKFYKNKYYFDTYIYSKDKNSLFYAEKILHILMNEVIDVETIEFLKLSKIPYTDFNKFKKNKDYFRDLIKINICFFNYIFSNIYKKIIFEEIIQIPYWLQSLKFLNLKYYYINYDQVFPKIASTVMNMLDIKSISAQWCEVSLPMSVNSFYNFDYYGLMGEEYRRVLIKNGSEIENFFVKGNSYSDIIILEEKEGKNFPYSNQKNIYKIVLFVDFFEFSNLFLDAPTYSRVFEKVKIFYATIKELIEKYPDVFIISSLRSEIAYKNLIEFDFMKHIINMNRVILDYKTSIPYLIANSDIIISQHISTTGIEAISSGKSIIYFELSNNKYHIYKKCGIVAYNKEELIEKFDRLYYNRNYYNYESILKKYSNGYSDGKNCERLRKKLELILSEGIRKYYLTFYSFKVIKI